MSADLDEPHEECKEMARALADPDVPVEYSAAFREYGLVYQDGGTSSLLITNCPWCGGALPSSLRDQWFDEVDALGLEPGDPEIPVRYASDRWWRE
jgi:hypothetical protein